jgi:DTW domain-containing protein YfiP
MRTRRVVRCAGCALPPALCMCAEVPRIVVRTRVVVLVHRNEVPKTTNTARFVAKMLDGAELRVRGERAGEPPGPLPEGRKVVLFPAEGARELGPDDRGEPLVLLVPDGSWAQARKAVRRDRALAGVETVALPVGARTRYRLRRNPCERGLCTLEAVARALGILESPDVEARMLRVLDRFVDRTLAVRSGRAGHAWQVAADVLTGDGHLR